jgi:hypothetical protein
MPASRAANNVSVLDNQQYTSANGVIAFSVTTPVAVYNTTVSISNTTGAFTIAGGLGVAGNVYANTIYTNSITFSDGSNQTKSASIEAIPNILMLGGM